ncbi:hypothetical protein EON65_22390 [archaeon]|nr:MAG: hypothetical protein EON65_22390 [archaeon]
MAYTPRRAHITRLAFIFCVFQALLAQQGEWRVSSPSLREALTLQLGQRIMPVYTNFFNTYSAIKFSKKHMTEYVRYSPSEMEKVLRNFFGKSG